MMMTEGQKLVEQNLKNDIKRLKDRGLWATAFSDLRTQSKYQKEILAASSVRLDSIRNQQIQHAEQRLQEFVESIRA